ncbi:DarT1-associated NADAR antitoxin family protein [Aliarcobacter butzleri]|uniref:DarT1-associated NADAR antitoxin family protein n=1 Tax=Aliarcobacter TaxID=2321111 RepID=UPI0021B5D4D9|nr:hypothetical protein [Aliarcobacter butzleri]MCT7621582.1 hypothetical protein [Aliarcobacter butzleri]
MANRPIFIVNENKKELFKQVDIDFTFYSGFAVTQKAKSIQSLHENAKKEGYKNILEVSTKSDNKLGWQLSAFNLMVDFDIDKKISLECAFQGSKVFKNNIKYEDLYFVESIKAKKDERLKKSGNIIGFEFEGDFWENEPKTAFYDYLYIKTLYSNYRDIINELIKFDTFTDIEFNPKKSINCQARTCAILVSLYKMDLLEKALNSKDDFINTVYKKEPQQLSLF